MADVTAGETGSPRGDDLPSLGDVDDAIYCVLVVMVVDEAVEVAVAGREGSAVFSI